MGTDVHHIFEKKVTKEDGTVTWERVEDEWDGGRSYFLFGWLANVRNGYGFAGCDLGDCIKPIDEPRGLPADRNYQVFKEYGEYDTEYYGVWLGDHSHSFATSTEILEKAQLINAVNRRGSLSLEQYHLWDKTSEPESYCGGSWGKRLFTVDSRGPDFKRQLQHHEYARRLHNELDNSRDRNQKTIRVREVTQTVMVDNNDVVGLMEDIFTNWNKRHPTFRKVKVARRVKVDTRRKSVLKHQRKLNRYLDRLGHMNVTCQWQETPDQIRQKFHDLLDEVKRLHDLHGEVRMVFGFDS